MVPGPVEFYLLHPKTKALAVSIRTGIDMAYYVRVPQQSSPHNCMKSMSGISTVSRTFQAGVVSVLPDLDMNLNGHAVLVHALPGVRIDFGGVTNFFSASSQAATIPAAKPRAVFVSNPIDEASGA